jgi:3-polyprenyl-4-hydroxybenzoate decarboxylase
MASLRTFLETLPETEVLTVDEEVNLDYHPTALVLALEQAKRFPVVRFNRPKGYDVSRIATGSRVWRAWVPATSMLPGRARSTV